jgi:hypothetical protein
VDLTPQEAKTLLERTRAAFRTAEFLIANGHEVTKEKMLANQREAAKQFTGSPAAGRRPFNTETALWMDDLLQRYNNAIVEDTVRLKTYVTTRLVEESDGEKAADRLRALESLGRLTQLGLFADKVEVNVTHRSTDELKQELAKKLSRYMGVAEEVKPTQKKKETKVIDLDEELGVVKLDKSEELDD